jgi:hypothetical protein
MKNKELAENYLARFRMGVVLDADVIALTAMLDMVEERGEMRSGWMMDEVTKEYDFTEEKTQ